MNVSEFIRKSIYEMALSKGADKLIAEECSIEGVDDWRKNKFKGKPLDLVIEKAKEAKKRSK